MKLMFIEGELQSYKEELTNTRQEQFLRLYDQCRLYFDYKLPEIHPPQSTTFMGIASINLSLMYLLTGQKHYLEEAKRWIFTAVSYEHWGNAHLVDVDLSAAWILFGLSLSYDWLKDSLTEQEEKSLREKLILQAERMYDFKKATVGEGWSTAFWQNHNWINHTGLAACGYALKDRYEKANDWIEDAKENFSIVYSVMAEDGSDYEGAVYWRYGVVWLLIYAHLLKVQEGIDYFKECSFLKNTFYYRLYQAVPNLQEIMNFGDCHDRRSAHSIAMYYKFAHEYGNGHAQFLANKVKEFLFREQYESGLKPGILPEAAFEFLWYDPDVKEKNFNDLPLVKYFEDLGLLTIRDSWKEDGTMLSFKCGAPGGKKQWNKSLEFLQEKNWNTRGLSHQHTDNNSFILHSHHAYLAVDDGYNRTVKASEHNVLVVDGKGYRDEGRNNVWKNTEQEAIGEIKHFHEEDNFVYILGESAKSYEKELELQWYGRSIFYTGRKYFLIMDRIESAKEHTYGFTLHSDVYPEEVDHKVFEYKNGPAKMRLYSIEPEPAAVKTKTTSVKAIMTTQEPDKFRETHMRTLMIENGTPLKKALFINVLVPESFFEEYGLSVERMQAEQGSGCTITNSGFKECFMFSDCGIRAGRIETDASWLYLRYEGEAAVEIKAFDGTYMEMEGQKYPLEKEKIVSVL